MVDYHKREGDYYLVELKGLDDSRPEEWKFAWTDTDDNLVSPKFTDVEDAEFWMMTDGQINLFGYKKKTS